MNKGMLIENEIKMLMDMYEILCKNGSKSELTAVNTYF